VFFTLLEPVFTGQIAGTSVGDTHTSYGAVGDTVAGLALQEDEVVTGGIADTVGGLLDEELVEV
jgi:hypothetical protein